ncbi:MAG: hypothetical protein EXX96DRAFT_481419, partial [Benjaminiella poitrasii]
IPTNLFRLRKRKLEAIYYYLFNHHLIHDKEPVIESMQTHQLAEYLLNTMYPGYPACKVKNIAYTDYRECREKEIGHINPLAYDYVPTTEIYDRLDEVYRLDIDWNKNYTGCLSIDMSSTALKRSIERIRTAHNDKPNENIEYHLCFMHVDITEKLIECLAKKPSTELVENDSDNFIKEENIQLEVELHDNEEYNISHISISAVIKKSTDELISGLYLQATTESIARAMRKSLSPLDTQQIAIHLLKQYHKEEKLKNAEAMFMTCQNNSMLSSTSSSTSSEEEYDESSESYQTISLVDSVTGQRIQHPAKSIHCKHRACFDAASFFDQYEDIKIWHCPICHVHIRGFEELRIDYLTKILLNQYPDEQKLYIISSNDDNITTTFLTQAELMEEEKDDSNNFFIKQDSIVVHFEDEKEQPSRKRYRAITTTHYVL